MPSLQKGILILLTGLMDDPNYENESEEATLMKTFNDCSGELKVGMKVFSKDEAYNLYNEYALRKSFSICRGNKCPDLNGILQQCEYLCSKAGYCKIGSIGEVKEFNHLETRTDCRARIRFTIDNGIWTISHLNDDHNHKLASSEERRNSRSKRKVLKAYGDVITSMVVASIKPTQSYNYLSKEIGPDYVGFTKEDCYNYLHAERENLIEARDGQSVINFFKRKQVEDPMFFYSIQVDEKM
ncbi:protein FAR1-RELATED SEQUENCE 3-like [Rhododendron vialii]|uniref:protein FAR1-RELATED SEQUENCE 3-like n=1 Tax=Rhododendron vialii TaxID=182163 RepID=UPI00265EFC2E|nr:protein FAR1-RELATED SEQUENCE 3-like [Rhododendron vialii]